MIMTKKKMTHAKELRLANPKRMTTVNLKPKKPQQKTTALRLPERPPEGPKEQLEKLKIEKCEKCIFVSVCFVTAFNKILSN